MEYEDELALAQSTPRIRIAFDEKKKQVLFETWPPLTGASYWLLDQLQFEYGQAKQAKKAPENYPFINSHQLAQRLNIDEPTVRKQISRFRRSSNERFIAAGGGPLPTDAIIETEPWAGYRLHPTVFVLAISELWQNEGVTSSKG